MIRCPKCNAAPCPITSQDPAEPARDTFKCEKCGHNFKRYDGTDEEYDDRVRNRVKREETQDEPSGRPVAVIVNGIRWKLDPLKWYDGADPQAIVEACGLLPHFLQAADDARAVAQFQTRYQFGANWNDGPGKVQPDGTFVYPEDDDMAPYLVAELHGDRIYIYPHALVSVVLATGEQQHTRMD
jgi:hypothetical protein